MSYSHVVDSYAWIEYFRASSEGRTAREYIEGEGSATPTIVVAEISRKLLREIAAGHETKHGRRQKLDFVRASTQIVDLTFDMADKAAEIDVEMKKKVAGWGLADSIVLATAQGARAIVVTGDSHFRELKEVLFIK